MITVKGEIDQRAVEQLERCVQAEEGSVGAILPDGHVGYSMPIGGVVGYREHLSPSGVGYDIGCGNKAVRTNLVYDDVRDDLPRIMDEIYRRISFGVGRINDEPLDHPVFGLIEEEAPLREIRDMLPKARKQLGTVGSGNHYVDLFRDETDRVWIGVHFGSRGFGHAIASGFLALAEGKRFSDRATHGEMDAPPTLLRVDSELGDSYAMAMGLAGNFAYAGRDVVCDKVLEILGAESMDSVHNHHNFTWRESHTVDGELTDLWVVRKGATPAFPGQRGFVGSTMGEPSVILRGKHLDDEDDAQVNRDEVKVQSGLLFSTVHGAGRVMSRTQAAGKQGNRAECTIRDCGYWVKWQDYRRERERLGLREEETYSMCPDHPQGRMQKRRGRIADGRINFEAVQRSMAMGHIELRGAGADEAPAAYKRLHEVLSYVSETIVVEHTLYPIGVAMASADTVDPWKD